MKTQQRINKRLKKITIQQLAAACLMSSSLAFGAPGAATVTHGSAAVTPGATTIVTQSTTRAVIEWDSFDLASSDVVLFSDNSDHATLNIINGNQASTIAGGIAGDGKIYLVNKNGIDFASGSIVFAGSLVASTLNIDSDAFMAENFQLLADETNKGIIINSGLIKAASGGSVALLGNSVINNGRIEAIAGRVTLAAGEAMTVAFDSSGLMQFEVTEEVSDNIANLDSALTNNDYTDENHGVITAKEIVIQAHVASNIFTNAVNLSGLIESLEVNSDDSGNVSLVAQGGNITLSDDAQILVSSEDQLTTQVNPLDQAGIAQELEAARQAEEAAAEEAARILENERLAALEAARQAEEAAAEEAARILENERLAALEAEATRLAAEEAASVVNADSGNPLPTTNVAANSSSLGLFNVESSGIRLPADQLEEEL